MMMSMKKSKRQSSRNKFDGYEIFVIPKENEESVVIYKENDSMFTGQEIKGKRNGFGSLSWMEIKDSHVFGKWEKDSTFIEEKYRIEYSTKKHYYGQVLQIKNQPVLFLEDFKFHGLGEYVEEGIKFYGYFANGLKNGPGILVHDRAKLKYYGYFKNDKYEGKGCLRNLKDDTLFIGSFKDGSFRGEGVIFFIKSNLCLKGNFQKNGKIKNAKLNKIIKELHYDKESLFDHSIIWDLLFSNMKYFQEKENGREMNLLRRGKFFFKNFELNYYGQSYFNFSLEYSLIEVISFIKHLIYFYNKSSESGEITKNKEDIQYFVCSKVSDSLFDFFVKKTESHNKIFRKKIKYFNSSKAFSKFQINYKLQFCDLTKSLQILNQLITTTNIIEKIKIMETFRETCILELQEIFKQNNMEEENLHLQINVDVLTEIFIILFAQSEIKQHFANFKLMKIWVDFHFAEYSSRKIMSILHFYKGFINFIEKLSDHHENYRFISKLMHYDVTEDVKVGTKTPKKKKKKKKKKPKERKDTIHEKIIPEGFTTIKDMINQSFEEMEKNGKNEEDDEEESEKVKKKMLSTLSEEQLDEFIKKSMANGEYSVGSEKKILFMRTLVRKGKHNESESEEEEDDDDDENEDYEENENVGEDEIEETENGKEFSPKTIITEAEDLSPKKDLATGGDMSIDQVNKDIKKEEVDDEENLNL